MVKKLKFQRLADNYFSTGASLRSACMAYIKKVLKENNNEISWNIDEVEDNILTVTYDGGNHPEYASTMASVVERIYVDNGKLYFDLEDESQYSFDRIVVNDLMWVCEDIMNNLENIEEDE